MDGGGRDMFWIMTEGWREAEVRWRTRYLMDAWSRNTGAVFLYIAEDL